MATITGTTGTDNFVGTDPVADVFQFSPSFLSGSDTVSGGGGSVNDIFKITAVGS